TRESFPQDVPVTHVAMGQRVLHIVGKRLPATVGDLVNGGGDEHLILVVNQLGQRVLCAPASCAKEIVGLPDTLRLRHVLHEQHHSFPDLTSQHDVQVL